MIDLNKSTEIKNKIKMKFNSCWRDLEFWKRVVGDMAVVIIMSVFVTPFSSHHGVLAVAEGLDYPYEQTYVISAYYSPLPCQQRYVTGSYDGDIRLNGGGVRGADGTPVFPGMIAAPKTYQFGTKIYIPGVGITEVHDRGGAIVSAGNRGHDFDRLDIWMGYGDAGLKRALNWGKRTVTGTNYGLNSDVEVQIILNGYSTDEAIPNDCSNMPETPVPNAHVPQSDTSTLQKLPSDYSGSLNRGMSGEAVIRLQAELMKINYFKGPLTGYYGELTEHAVYKFQQSQNLVGSRDSAGAGVYGPRTQDRLGEIVAARNYRNTAVAAKKAGAELAVGEAVAGLDKVNLNGELGFGVSDPEVEKLQIFLRDKGYFNESFTSNYYGPQTYEAVMKFQLDHGLINSEGDRGAGRVGPSTLKLINALS